MGSSQAVSKLPIKTIDEIKKVFLLVVIALLNSFIETDYAMISSLHPAAFASVVPISIGCPKWLCDSINLSGVRYTEGHHHWLTFLSLSVAFPNNPNPSASGGILLSE